MHQAKENEQPSTELPKFITEGTGVDILLFTVFMLIGVYGLVLSPFVPKLLVSNPELLIALTGSSNAMVVLGAHYSTGVDNHYILWGALAVLSSVKFLPVYYLIGSRWGEEFIHYLFQSRKKPPLWYRKTKNFIHNHPLVSLGAGYIPFSPIPHTLVVVFTAISAVKPMVVAASILMLATLLKTFYFVVGYIFGEEVIGVLATIDKYMLYITLGIIAVIFFKSLRDAWSKAKMGETKSIP